MPPREIRIRGPRVPRFSQDRINYVAVPGGGPPDPPDPPPQPPPAPEGREAAIGVSPFLSFRTHKTLPTYDEAKTVSAVTVTTQPTHGFANPNPDHTISLQLNDVNHEGSDSFVVDVDYDDATSEQLTYSYTVALPEGEEPGARDYVARKVSGWGKGRHYLLRVDPATGMSMPLRTLQSRDYYVTAGSHGLTKAQIASLEGLSEADITDSWIASSNYGRDATKPLAWDWFQFFFTYNTNGGRMSKSPWIYLERGYIYRDGRTATEGTRTASPLHPVVVRPYGSGSNPQRRQPANTKGGGYGNYCYQQIDGDVGSVIGLPPPLYNILVEKCDLSLTDANVSQQKLMGATFREVVIMDNHRSGPVKGQLDWTRGGDNRLHGYYGSRVNGMLWEHAFVADNGYSPGYDFFASGDYPHPFSLYGHNFYLQFETRDVTIRDMINMRGSSIGIKGVGGFCASDTALVENQVPMVQHLRNYGYFGDVVATVTGWKRVNVTEGGYNWGFTGKGWGHFWDNVLLAHYDHIDAPASNSLPSRQGINVPANERYRIATGVRGPTSSSFGTWMNPTQAGIAPAPDSYPGLTTFNWGDWPDEYAEDVNVTTAMQTDVKAWIGSKVGKPMATLDELKDWIRTQSTLKGIAADLVAYFREGFFGETPRTVPQAIRFVPDPRADGKRWDFKANWNPRGLPLPGDTIDLGGNRTYYCENYDLSASVVHLSDGWVTIFGGYWAPQEVVGPGLVEVDYSGLAEIKVVSGGPRLRAKQGMLVISDDLSDVDVEVQNHFDAGTHGEITYTQETRGTLWVFADDYEISFPAYGLLALPGKTLTISAGRELRIVGAPVVGFDGQGGGTTTIDVDGELVFEAWTDALGTLREIHTGFVAPTTAPNVNSVVNLTGCTLRLDLGRLASGGAWTLIDVDQIVGTPASAVLTNGGSWNVSLTLSGGTLSVTVTPGTGVVTTSW